MNSLEQMCVNDDCCVCLCPVPRARLKLLPCNHVLHKGCAVRWFARNRSCPLCRQYVPPLPSSLLRKAFRRLNVPRLALALPTVAKAELHDHPDSGRVVALAFMTVDSVELLRVLRALGL